MSKKDKNAEKQGENRDYAEIRPWQFKPGQSGNPGGRPKGAISLKEYAKKMLYEMSEEERMEYMKGLDKDLIWKMAEGNPKQDTEIKGNVTISQVLDQLDGQTTEGQNMETESPLQDQEQEGEASAVQVEPSADPLPPTQVV